MSWWLLCGNKCSPVSFALRVFPLFWNYGGTFLVCGSLETLSDMVPHSAYMTQPGPRDWGLGRSYKRARTHTQKYYLQVSVRFSTVPHNSAPIESAISAALPCWFSGRQMIFHVFHFIERKGTAKTLLSYCCGVISNPGVGPSISTDAFRDFPPFLHTNAVIVPLNRPLLLPSIPALFIIHDHSTKNTALFRIWTVSQINGIYK